MTTRILLFLLLSFLPGGAPAAPAGPLPLELRPPTVGVMLKFDRQPAPAFLKQLQKDVAAILRPTGLDLHWEMVGAGHHPGAYDRVVVLEMRGYCSGLRSLNGEPPPEGGLPLGWTLINNGEVIPYAIVDCDQMARALAQPQLRIQSRQLLPSLYSRLASRVVAHELMHTLLRSADHHDSDCTRSPLRAVDLTREVRLRPNEVAALREIGRPSGTALAHVP
ncbi:MAG: hypothetical protein HY238_08175 [Acidobacteria bacterium]|nr:hypothetical protein [Acidobacteriota bacterium]